MAKSKKKGGKKGTGGSKGKKGKKGKKKPLTARELEMKRKKAEAEAAEKKRLEEEKEAAAKKKAEMETSERPGQIQNSANCIATFDYWVLGRIQKNKSLQEWRTFVACRNVPDFVQLSQVNAYVEYWRCQLEQPNMKTLLKLAPELLQVIEELKDFLQNPAEQCNLDVIKELGLLYHDMIVYQWRYMDKCTYAIIQDLSDLYDPEVGIVDYLLSIPQITHCLWGNMFLCPDHDEFDFTDVKFKFKLPEALISVKGIYRLIKTEYDHYSTACKSYFAPGVDNALKRAIQDWIEKNDQQALRAELQSPEERGSLTDASKSKSKHKKKKKKGKKGKKRKKKKKKGKGKGKSKKGKKGKKKKKKGGVSGTESEFETTDTDGETKKSKKGKKKKGKKSKSKMLKKSAKSVKVGTKSDTEATTTTDQTTETEGEETTEPETTDAEEKTDKKKDKKKKEREEKPVETSGEEQTEGEGRVKETREERRERRRREAEMEEEKEFEYTPAKEVKPKATATEEQLKYEDDSDTDIRKKRKDSDSDSDEDQKKKQKKHVGTTAPDTEGKKSKKAKGAQSKPEVDDDGDDSHADHKKSGMGRPSQAKSGTASEHGSASDHHTEEKSHRKSQKGDVGSTGGSKKKLKKSKSKKGKKKKGSKKKKSKKGKKGKSKKGKKGSKKGKSKSKGSKGKGKKGSKKGKKKGGTDDDDDESDEEEGGGGGKGKKGKGKGKSKDKGKSPGKKDKKGKGSKGKDKKGVSSSKSKSKSKSPKSSKGSKKGKKDKKGKKGKGSKGKKGSKKGKKGKKGKGKKGKKGRRGKSKKGKGKKKKKKGKSKDKHKTEAELAKERERKEKAEFIPTLHENELNLRMNQILGGTYAFQLLDLPPQPVNRGVWTIHLKEYDCTLKEVPFMAEFEEPPPPDLDGSKKQEEEAKKQEEEKEKLAQADIVIPDLNVSLQVALSPEEEAERLAKLAAESQAEFDAEMSRRLSYLLYFELEVPKKCLWFETPVPVRWEPVLRFWSTAGFHDIKFNEETLKLSFRTTRFGIFGLGHNRWLNLPYQSWELRPLGRDKVMFALTGAKATLEFIVHGDVICVSNIDNVNNAETVKELLLNKFMSPHEFIKALRAANLDVFPEIDSYAYVDGILTKNWETEDHLYQCMALAANAYNFEWSHWNLPAGREKLVYQMRERHGASLETPGDYKMVVTTPKKCLRIDCTETSTSFTETPLEEWEFHADLLNLVRKTSTPEALGVLSHVNPHHVETVRILLASVRPLTFA